MALKMLLHGLSRPFGVPIYGRLLASSDMVLQAHVLLAADVAYESSMISPLFRTIRVVFCSLGDDKTTHELSCRPHSETNRLLTYYKIRSLRKGIVLSLLADGTACERRIPVHFLFKFVQPRSNVNIIH